MARPGVDLYAVAVTFLELLTGVLPSRSIMGHKARIRKFIAQMPSGSVYIDELAIEFASKCATACSRPGETVRVGIRQLNEQVFNINDLELIALRAICRNFAGGAKKDEMAEFLFGTLAHFHGWQNRTEQRTELLKEVVTGLYQKDMLILRGQRYFPA